MTDEVEYKREEIRELKATLNFIGKLLLVTQVALIWFIIGSITTFNIREVAIESMGSWKIFFSVVLPATVAISTAFVGFFIIVMGDTLQSS
jgi:hypothetical protein